jgi:HAD superfamily hydrolase (TIGR01509 family)
MLKAVIFDMDGVLLDSFEANLDFFQRLMVKAGYSAPTREEYLEKGFHKSMADVVKMLVEDAANEEVERILDFRRKREIVSNHDLLKFPQGLEEVIKKLSKNHKLAIVTSRIKDSVYKHPQMAALKKYFETDVAYEDTTNHKPHPEPLLLATEILGLCPEECVYVGDAQSDLDASHSAGMKCVILSTKRFESADAYTDDFRKIPEVIKSLG